MLCLIASSTFGFGPAKLRSGYCCLRSRTVAVGTPMTKLPNTLSPGRVSTRKYRFSRDITEGWYLGRWLSSMEGIIMTLGTNQAGAIEARFLVHSQGSAGELCRA